jgi:AcrR family transcriptional regulator
MNAATTPLLSARTELAALTRDRILGGLAALLRQSDDEVTFERLALEARVPQRTLYRYYANKEALFSAFWPWVNESIETPPRPTTTAELVAHIPALFAAFERDEALVRAMLHNPHGRAVRLANADARRKKFEAALSDVTARLSGAEAKRLLAAVTALCSASGWETMKDNWGLSGPVAAEAAQWAVEALIDEARGHSRSGSS